MEGSPSLCVELEALNHAADAATGYLHAVSCIVSQSRIDDLP
jgi:hypothetical protein